MTHKSFDNVAMKWWEIRVRLPLMQMVFLSRALERSLGPTRLVNGESKPIKRCAGNVLLRIFLALYSVHQPLLK